jgi:hypothetical protein
MPLWMSSGHILWNVQLTFLAASHSCRPNLPCLSQSITLRLMTTPRTSLPHSRVRSRHPIVISLNNSSNSCKLKWGNLSNNFMVMNRPHTLGCGPIHRSPECPSHEFERYTPAGGRFVYQSCGRSSHEAESSRQGSVRYHNSNYHPQYDRRTLATRRGSLPHLYNDIRWHLVPSQFNSQAATPTSARTRQERQLPPSQQIM